MKTATLASVLVIFCAAVMAAAGNRYLRPHDFKSVPARIRAQLEQQHCLIPQDVETPGPHNIVTGQFAKRGQQDWAAYCSVDGKSHVMVIWGGPAHCSGDPFGIPPVSDDSVYRTADPQQAGRMPPRGSFWTLSVVPRDQVVARQRAEIAERGELLESASHDAFQRASIAGVNGVYCENGKWRGLWYAD